MIAQLVRDIYSSIESYKKNFFRVFDQSEHILASMEEDGTEVLTVNITKTKENILCNISLFKINNKSTGKKNKQAEIEFPVSEIQVQTILSFIIHSVFPNIPIAKYVNESLNIFCATWSLPISIGIKGRTSKNFTHKQSFYVGDTLGEVEIRTTGYISTSDISDAFTVINIQPTLKFLQEIHASLFTIEAKVVKPEKVEESGFVSGKLSKDKNIKFLELSIISKQNCLLSGLYLCDKVEKYLFPIDTTMKRKAQEANDFIKLYPDFFFYFSDRENLLYLFSRKPLTLQALDKESEFSGMITTPWPTSQILLIVE